jgi:hypothetical protein
MNSGTFDPIWVICPIEVMTVPVQAGKPLATPASVRFAGGAKRREEVNERGVEE